MKAIKVLFKWLIEEEGILKSPAPRLQKPIGPKRVKVTFATII